MTAAKATLTMKDLAVLSEKLHPIASQWYSLGIQLGFDPGELRIIQQQVASEPVDALNRLLEKWLKRSDPPSTLEAMVKVVGGKVIGNEQLSRELQDECADFPSVGSKQPGTSTSAGAGPVSAAKPGPSVPPPNRIHVSKLKEYCEQQKWPQPIYTLIPQPQEQQFQYQAMVKTPTGSFTAMGSVCGSKTDAKHSAAQAVLQKLP